MGAETSTRRAPLLCHRCGRELTPGEGSFYVVRIEAFADPTPPSLDPGDPGPTPGELDRLIEQASGWSERELMDQVYRTVTVHLCRRCYEDWIEHPVG